MKDEIDDGAEDKGMKVGHDEKTDDDSDNTSEFDMVVRVDAVGKIVGNRFIEINNGNAGKNESDATKKPSNTKSPVHIVLIIAWRTDGCKDKFFGCFWQVGVCLVIAPEKYAFLLHFMGESG